MMWFTCNPKIGKPKMTVETCREVSQAKFRSKELADNFDPKGDKCYGCTYWRRFLPSRKRIRKGTTRRRRRE